MNRRELFAGAGAATIAALQPVGWSGLWDEKPSVSHPAPPVVRIWGAQVENGVFSRPIVTSAELPNGGLAWFGPFGGLQFS